MPSDDAATWPIIHVRGYAMRRSSLGMLTALVEAG